MFFRKLEQFFRLSQKVCESVSNFKCKCDKLNFFFRLSYLFFCYPICFRNHKIQLLQRIYFCRISFCDLGIEGMRKGPIPRVSLLLKLTFFPKRRGSIRGSRSQSTSFCLMSTFRSESVRFWSFHRNPGGLKFQNMPDIPFNILIHLDSQFFLSPKLPIPLLLSNVSTGSFQIVSYFFFKELVAFLPGIELLMVRLFQNPWLITIYLDIETRFSA